MMAERALRNPYADYDKSLATNYFDGAGRVSGVGRGGTGPYPVTALAGAAAVLQRPGKGRARSRPLCQAARSQPGAAVPKRL